MAMTKKERAAVDAELRRANVLAALRWTGAVEPDVPPPTGEGYTSGWIFNVYYKTVEQAWSSALSHGDGLGPKPAQQSFRRGPICMFSTRAKALAALRNELERQCANSLADVDALLAKAKAEEQKEIQLAAEPTTDPLKS